MTGGKHTLHIPYDTVLTFKRPDGNFGSVNSSIFVDAVKEFENIISVFENV